MNERTSLGILPVRAGSEGIPGKNVRSLGGRPLLTWAAEALVSSRVSLAFCSTDSEEMARIAQDAGLTAHPLRPAQLATPTSLVNETVRHVLAEQEALGYTFEHVVLVQATSPFVESKDIDKTLELLSGSEVDSVVSVTTVPDHFHPSLMYRNVRNQLKIAGDRSDTFVRRQDRKPWFRRVGLVYGFKVESFLETSNFVSGKVGFLHIDVSRAIDIDSEEDFQAAENFLATLGSNPKSSLFDSATPLICPPGD